MKRFLLFSSITHASVLSECSRKIALSVVNMNSTRKSRPDSSRKASLAQAKNVKKMGLYFLNN